MKSVFLSLLTRYIGHVLINVICLPTYFSDLALSADKELLYSVSHLQHRVVQKLAFLFFLAPSRIPLLHCLSFTLNIYWIMLINLYLINMNKVVNVHPFASISLVFCWTGCIWILHFFRGVFINFKFCFYLNRFFLNSMMPFAKARFLFHRKEYRWWSFDEN